MSSGIALSSPPEAVIALAQALGEGLRQAGMGSCGKHYPAWLCRSRFACRTAVDDRAFAAMQEDIEPIGNWLSTG